MHYLCPPPAVPSQRSVLHRVLVCAGAFLCLPIILGLARCLSSEVKPQPLPRTLVSTHSAVYRDQPQPAPQPPPRRPVPQKRSTPSHKGILVCNTDKKKVTVALSKVIYSLSFFFLHFTAAPKTQQKTEVGKHPVSRQDDLCSALYIVCFP